MHKRLFIVLFLLFWSPSYEQWLRKSCKVEKHLQTIQACLLIALIHYVPQCKIYGTQEEAWGRNSVSWTALPPTMPCWDGGGRVRGLGAHLLMSTSEKERLAWLVNSPYTPVEHIPSGAFTQSCFISIHDRVQRAIKTDNFFVCLFQVIHLSMASTHPTP